MARLLFCEQFYHPDGWSGTQLLRDVTTHLSRQGHQVTVLCGSDPYVLPGDQPDPDPRDDGVRIVRTPRLLSGDIKRLKLIRQLWFYLCATWLLLIRGSPDLFVSQTNPPLIVTIVAAIAKMRRRPLLIIAQDLYPEVLIAFSGRRRWRLLMGALRGLLNVAYRSAMGVVALGSSMSERIRAKGVRGERISVISNWATGDQGIVRDQDNRLRRAWSLESKFVLLYSGNIGVGHEFETLLGALDQVRASCPRVMLVVIGRGARLSEIVAGVSARGLGEHVQIRDLVSQSLLPHSLGLADLAVATLRPGFEGLMVPSKTLGYMARGVPFLYIGPRSEVTEWIDASGCGIACANGDVEAVSRAIRQAYEGSLDLAQMGCHARDYYSSALSASCGLLKYDDVIRRCLSQQPA